MQKHTMSLLAVAVVLMGLLAFTGVGGLASSVSSISNVLVYDPAEGGTGEYWWVTTGYIQTSYAQPLAGFTFSANNAQEGDTSIEPKKAVYIEQTTTPQRCIYAKGSEISSWSAIGQTVISYYENFKVYNVKNVENSMITKFTVYKASGTSKTLLQEITVDLADVSTHKEYTISDWVDGKGTLIFNANGITQGVQNCPTDNIIWYERNGKVYLVDRDEFQEKINEISLSILLSGEAQNWLKNPPTTEKLETATVSYDASTSKVIASLASGGAGIFTIKANADFFDSAFVLKERVGKPKIVLPLTKTESVVSGGQTAWSALVLNEGDDAEITVKATATKGTFTGSPKTISIGGGKQAVFSFPLSVGTIPDATAQNCVTIEACSKSVCDIATECQTITKEQPTKYCGDATCSPETGETTLTCPQDCKQTPQTCDKPNMYRDDDGYCQCREGYVGGIDQTGGYICVKEKEDNTLLYLAGGAVAFLVIVGGALLLTGKKGKIRRRR